LGETRMAQRDVVCQEADARDPALTETRAEFRARPALAEGAHL
jgi:hypothetical protein